MTNEIGSEFSKQLLEQGTGIINHRMICDQVLTFSGRTAIETAIRNIDQIHKAMLPSYCCDSMIAPFRDAGIEVDFYDVFYENGLKIRLSIPDSIDLLLWCDYFGFRIPVPDIKSFKQRGGVIIEDITHSFFSKIEHIGDYIVASLRKWEPIYSGGFCGSMKGKLVYKPNTRPPQSFNEMKNRAMELKSSYLEDLDENKKIKYLALFRESNKWIADHYSGLLIDSYSELYLKSVNSERQKEIRRANARVLFEGIDGHTFIKPLFHIDDMDCPLFVPVVVGNGMRDTLRRQLIENKIYCPIHWPHPLAECSSNLYNLELSLICDQRYDEEDMHRIVKILKNT